MLRITVNTNAQSAKEYYTASLARNDYYHKGGELEIVGQWHGRGSALLGLAGGVTRDTYFALCDNRHPATAEQLTPRMKDGRRVGYDLTFSASKSVSILYALSGDSRILDAFQASVQDTMRQIERDMQTRVRKDGAFSNRATENMVWADFSHFTARPVDGTPDMDLHSHNVAFNVTWDSVEGRWKAGEFHDLHINRPYYEAAFHARLAAQMKALGFDIERGGRDGKYWDVAGVPRDLIEKFSRRTAEIDARAKALGMTDPDAKGELGAKTRDYKTRDMTMPQLVDHWRGRMSKEDWPAYHAVWEQASGGANGTSEQPAQSWGQWLRGLVSSPAHVPAQPITAHAALEYAVEHEFTRASVVPVNQLMETALRFGTPGGVLPEEVARLVDAGEHGILTATADGRKLATTREVHAEEQAMLALARDGCGAAMALGLGHPEYQSSRLNDGQLAAVRHVLASHDRVMMLRGHAGTGKTTLMQAAVPAIEQASGKKVFTFAPWSDAARGTLRQEGFHDANTVAHLLDNEVLHRRIRGQVIWIDEAGQLGTRDMRRVLELAGELDCRVILAGDPGQHGSVARGDALRLLESHGGLRPAVVSDIVRQKGAYRDAASLLAHGETLQGLDALDKLGWVIEEKDAEQRNAMLARDYVAFAKAGKSLAVVAPTHREGREVAAAVREALRREGVIQGDDRQFFTLRNLQWTDAQKGDAVRYRPGLVVQFTQNAKGIQKNGSRWQVSRIEDGNVWLWGQEGETLLPRSLGKRFNVYEPDTMALAAGDPVRITGGGAAKDGRKLNNGAVYAVKSFTPAGDVLLTDMAKRQKSWVLPAEYAHFTTGYYTTSHAAQSKTVDHVLIAQSSTSFAASSQEQAYVSATRGRQSARLYTDDKAALRDHVIRSGQRGSATELLGAELDRTTQPRQAAEQLARMREALRRSRKQRKQKAVMQHVHAAAERENFRELGFVLEGDRHHIGRGIGHGIDMGR